MGARTQAKSNKRRRRKKCAMCGRSQRDDVTLTTHHVFHGRKYKKLSDKYGFVITLCWECHKRLHSSRVIDRMVQQTMQHEYEKTHSREEFVALMGRSWITEADDAKFKEESRLESAISLAMQDLGLDKTQKM